MRDLTETDLPDAEASALPGSYLRPVVTEGLRRANLTPQAAPQLTWIEIAQIRFDDRFQRPLGRSNQLAIARIAAQFQWSRFSPVLLSPIEGGLFSCLDGQHRTHAAALCGIVSVPAMVVLVPPAEMAAAFIHINAATIRVTPHNLYRAGLMAGESWAISMRNAVEAAGCKLALGNASTATKKPGTLYCIALIRKLVVAGHGDLVTAGLQALRQFDDKGRVALWSDYVLAPWLGAVAAAGVADVDRLVDVLSRRDPFLVIEAATKSAKARFEPLAAARRRMFEHMIGGSA
jgi:hypothetical protein